MSEIIFFFLDQASIQHPRRSGSYGKYMKMEKKVSEIAKERQVSRKKVYNK